MKLSIRKVKVLTSEIVQKIAELEKKCGDLSAQKREIDKRLKEIEKEKLALGKEVKPIYRFTLLPMTERNWDKIYDDSCCFYTLKGDLLNKKELERAGFPYSEGQHSYLFNSLSGKIVTRWGGGMVYTEDPEAFRELSYFIVDNPKGGDVTAIVEKYR